jgi:hypothetical protein
MGTKRLTGAIVIVALLLTVLTPRRASADITQGLIIGGIIAGGVLVVSLVIGLIAVAGSSDEPHFLTEPPAGASSKEALVAARARVRFGVQCQATAEGPALMCW